MLTQELYKAFDPVITRHRIHEQELFNSSSITDNIDYRHLVIVRNMYDAIVSGFLYHQTGHECWLSMTGYKIGREKNFDWEPYITYHGAADYPARNGRSICRYICDEERTIAMRVYIDVALSKWYAGLEPYFGEMRRREQRKPIRQSMVVCFEDYTNATKQLRIYDETMEFFFPSGVDSNTYHIPVHPEAYSGGHATSHEPMQRQVLLDLVHELDETIFDNSLRRLNSLFDCGNG